MSSILVGTTNNAFFPYGKGVFSQMGKQIGRILVTGDESETMCFEVETEVALLKTILSKHSFWASSFD